MEVPVEGNGKSDPGLTMHRGHQSKRNGMMGIEREGVACWCLVIQVKYVLIAVRSSLSSPGFEVCCLSE